MGLHDRDWYQRELEKKGGRPMTFDQKMAASAASQSSSKKTSINNPHPNNARKKPVFHVQKQKQKEWSPVILAVVTVVALAILSVVLRFVMHH